jgi:hypothetical protein
MDPASIIGRLRIGGLFLAAILAVGCAATANQTAGDGAEPGTTAADESPALATLTPTSTAGTGALTCTPIGGATPRFTVVAPVGWTAYRGDCGFVVPSADVFTAGLSAWIVGQVPTDPCRNRATLTRPGDTVDDLVGALGAQVGRNATAPVDVTLGGYEGTYLEWSVPTDIVVLDAEYHVEGCDDGNFLSWLGRDDGTRYQQVGGQVDQLWVLDIEGQRVVVDASYAPDASQAVKNELATMVKTLGFVTP